MALQFYDKQGKIFPFEGNEQQFNQWNKFGFSLVPNTPPSDQNTVIPSPVVPPVQQPVQDNSDPITKFNMAILNMLKEAQGGAGNEDLYKQQTGLQRAMISRQGAMTPEDLRMLSPSQQAAIRSGNMQALEPEIDAIGAKIKANDARLQNFESILGQMRAIGNDITIKPSDEIILKYINMLENGGSLSSVPDEFQKYVMEKTTPDTWKRQAAAIAAAKNSGDSGQDYPSSYKEWLLAGSPGTFADWVKKGSGIKLPANQVTMLSNARYFPSLLDNLEKTINDNKGLFGVISGRIPLSESRAKVEDDLRRATQLIGSFMEGGVLRKEDEIKYAKMLPQLTDQNPSVALDKLAGVRTMLQEKYNNYLSDFSGSGYDVSGFDSIDFNKSTSNNIITQSDGTQWRKNPDGSMTRIK